MESAIDFKSLTKIYAVGFWGKKQKALHSASFSVPKNSIYGFLGANGAGKTTAIKILMGLQFPTEGEVLVFGIPPLDPKAKARIGYLPERPYFHGNMKVHEFLNFHRNLFSPSLAGKKLPSNEELLKLVGLEQVAEKSLKDFSKGMLQRAGIAQALVNDPDLVVLDEPMSGLDPVGRRDMRDLILKLYKLGKTIFFSSHILSDIESVCHRIAFLEKGVLKYEGLLSEILRSEAAPYEVQFSGISEAALQASGLLSKSHIAGQSRLVLCPNNQEAKRVIEEVWRLGGNLNSYHREQRTLEEFLYGKAVSDLPAGKAEGLKND